MPTATIAFPLSTTAAASVPAARGQGGSADAAGQDSFGNMLGDAAGKTAEPVADAQAKVGPDAAKAGLADAAALEAKAATSLLATAQSAEVQRPDGLTQEAALADVGPDEAASLAPETGLPAEAALPETGAKAQAPTKATMASVLAEAKPAAAADGSEESALPEQAAPEQTPQLAASTEANPKADTKPAQSSTEQATGGDAPVASADATLAQIIQPQVQVAQTATQTAALASVATAQATSTDDTAAVSEEPVSLATNSGSATARTGAAATSLSAKFSAQGAETVAANEFENAVTSATSGEGEAQASTASASKGKAEGLPEGQALRADAGAPSGAWLTQTMVQPSRGPLTLPYASAMQGTAASAATQTVSVVQGTFGTEMGVRIARAVDAGSDDILIKLDPRDLGRINVRLSFDSDGVLRATMSADNHGAADLLRRESGDLVRSLADAGIRADGQSLRFDSRGSFAGGGFAGQGGGNGSSGSQGNSGGGQGRSQDGFAGADEPVYRSLGNSGHVDLLA